MALQFTRNATVYVELLDSNGYHKNGWQLSVLDGFSFTQSINSSEITINEAGSTSRRARLLFNDSLAPVEWSMSTYARPFTDDTRTRAPEDVLWAMAMGGSDFAIATDVFSGTGALNTIAAGTNTFDFGQSNVSSFSDNWNIYFGFEDGTNIQYYKLQSSVVNSVSMDFDIDGIATIAWSGFAKQLGDESTVKPGFVDPKQQTVSGSSGDGEFATLTVGSSSDFRVGQRIYVEGMSPSGYDTADIGSLKNPAGALITALTPTTISYASTQHGSFVSGGTVGSLKDADQTSAVISTGLSTTTNFIRNRISKVTLRNETGGLTDDYTLVLTGGNFTLENNINYLTPEELGVVNAPLANITGARSISGSMTCYLDNDTVGEKSGKLFADLVSDTSTIRNVFNMQLQMGGDTSSTPRVYLDMPTAHLEVPTINVEDLLTLEINFHGQVADGNVDNTNEATIIYNS
jgi:hypothetical protein